MHLLVPFLLTSLVSKIHDVQATKKLPYGIQAPYPYGAKGDLAFSLLDYTFSRVLNDKLSLKKILHAKEKGGAT